MALLTLKFVTDVRNDDHQIIELHGELDQSTLPNTEKQIIAFLADFGRKYLILDLTDLKFINSEGIGFIVSMHTKLAKKGKNLILCGMQGNVKDVFEVIGMSKMLPVYKNIAEAVAPKSK